MSNRVFASRLGFLRAASVCFSPVVLAAGCGSSEPTAGPATESAALASECGPGSGSFCFGYPGAGGSLIGGAENSCQGWYGRTKTTANFNVLDENDYPDLVRNNCNTRLWLHENLDGSGLSFCLSPNSSQIHLYRTWRQFYLSTNHEQCD